jgi:hypothetical protein
MFEDHHSAGALPGPFPLRERDGSNAIERKAVYRAQVEIRSMPASLVVQIALWPDKLADWAKETAVAPAVVYNMLAGVKPYHRVRTLLARRLDVPKRVLDHLIDAPRPEPLAKIPPDPPADPGPSIGSPEDVPPPGPAASPAAPPVGRVERPRSLAATSPPSTRRTRTRGSAPNTQIPLNL